MRHPILKSRWVIRSLVAIFTAVQVIPVLVQATDTEPLTSTITVISLYQSGAAPDKTDRATEELRRSLSSKAGVTVLSRTETEELVGRRPELAGRSDDTLGAEVRKSYDEYFTLDLESGLARINRALAELESREYPSRGDFDIVGAYIIRGMHLLALGRQAQASGSFREAARLDPARVLSEVDFSPTVRRTFDEARASLEQDGKFGWLVINAYPGSASVRINGVDKGKTPFITEKFPAGRHFVTVSHKGFAPDHGVVTVDPATPAEMVAKLKKPEGKEAGPFGGEDGAAAKGLFIADLTDVESQRAMAVNLGNVAGADRIVLVSTENLGWGWRVSARVVDVTTGKAHQFKSVEVNSLPEESAAAANVLADFVAGGGAGGETIALSRAVFKHFYQRPLFWIGVGVAAAGAGLGTAILLSSEDSSSSAGSAGSSGAGGVTLEVPAAP